MANVAKLSLLLGDINRGENMIVEMPGGMVMLVIMGVVLMVAMLVFDNLGRK